MTHPKVISVFFLLFSITGHAESNAENKDTKSKPTAGESWSLTQKPRWEFGLGGGYIDDFDYPASDSPNRTGLILPFFIYRGASMRFSGRNISAIALEDPRFKIDFSVGAALSAKSEGNEVREGMPDLDFLFEFGPQLTARLIDKPTWGGKTLVNWRNRVRAVFSTDFGSVNSQGWLFQSQLQARQSRLGGSPKIDALSGLTFTWTTEKLQDYFYQVAPEFETPTRPTYQANSGYLGANLFIGLVYRPVPQFRVFTGIRHGYFKGAANEDSPLFETTSSTGYAIGLVWTIVQSKDTIGILDDE